MENPILYIVLNGELRMSPGKAAAQAVHAAMSLENKSETCVNGLFARHNKRTVIVLEAEHSEQLRNLKEYLKGAGIFSTYYIDEGANEVSPYSITALAVAPFDDKDEEKRAILSSFKLFRGVYEEDEKTRFQWASIALRTAIPYKDDRNWFVRQTIKWLDRQR